MITQRGQSWHVAPMDVRSNPSLKDATDFFTALRPVARRLSSVSLPSNHIKKSLATLHSKASQGRIIIFLIGNLLGRGIIINQQPLIVRHLLIHFPLGRGLGWLLIF